MPKVKAHSVLAIVKGHDRCAQQENCISHRSSVVGKMGHTVYPEWLLEEVLPLPGVRGRLETEPGAKEQGVGTSGRRLRRMRGLRRRWSRSGGSYGRRRSEGRGQSLRSRAGSAVASSLWFQWGWRLEADGEKVDQPKRDRMTFGSSRTFCRLQTRHRPDRSSRQKFKPWIKNGVGWNIDWKETATAREQVCYQMAFQERDVRRRSMVIEGQG